MAYFDSSKNRALWEIRLTALRKERAAREEGKEGSDLGQMMQDQPVAEASRVHMTYTDLLKEEADAVKKPSKREHAGMEKTLESREKEARTYEKT